MEKDKSRSFLSKFLFKDDGEVKSDSAKKDESSGKPVSSYYVPKTGSAGSIKVSPPVETQKNSSLVVNAILPIIASFHAFLASFTLFREGMDISKIKTLIKKGPENKDAEIEFLELVEDRIPDPLKYVLLSTGFIIQLWTATLYYPSYWTGLFSVLSISYIIILIWEVIIDLDDPVHGIWIVRGIPPSWAQKAHFEKRLVDIFFDSIFGELNS